MSRLALALWVLAVPSLLRASPVEILSADANGLTLQIDLSSYQLAAIDSGGHRLHDLVAPGYPRLGHPGQANLPFIAELLAVPAGARVQLSVQDTRYVDLEDIDFITAPDDSQPQYEQNAILPTELAISEYLGIVRGVPAHALRVYPFRYDEARRVLRVYQQLRLRVDFVGSYPAPKTRARDPHGDLLYRVFLNPPSSPVAAPEPSRKAVFDQWYDPTFPWVKLFVEEDGLFRIDPDWLQGRKVDVEEIDPRTFRLFYLGEEQPLHARGEGDGRFDPGDYLLFYGRFRRDEIEPGRQKDFGSLYGNRNTYWLTWGEEAGRRFSERSGAPVNNYPQSTSFWTTAHFEQDLHYDPLPAALDNRRDHWFWREPVSATRPEVPSAAIFVGDLKSPDLTEDYTAWFRASLHGTSDLGHHTVIKLNARHTLVDTIWGGKGEGQVELPIAREISSTFLRQGTNRVLLQVFADQEKFDLIYFNWFAIGYRRFYQAWSGQLEFSQPFADGRRVTIFGLRDTRAELFDVTSGVRFTDLQIDSVEAQVQVTFEDSNADSATYIIADSLALKTPEGKLDQSSTWSRLAHGADYLIVVHPDFLAAAGRLADHRRSGGLQVEVVNSEDIYDEFSYGRVDRQAVADFVRHAYVDWEPRPSYLLFLGDDNYDYRNIKGGGTPPAVPTLYYQSRDRGDAPSDFLYTLVDGDDLLADLAVGRLAVESSDEALQSVDKIIRYDRDPEPGDWRSRVIYLANYHPKQTFTEPSDFLAARYTEPLGFQSVKIYNPDESPFPNLTGRKFLDALNAGALLLNYNGHGSAGTMQFIFSMENPDWDYLSQVHNGGRLPLVLALSCLNSMFVNPIWEGLGETLTARAEGGAIAYISATEKSRPSQNNLLSEQIFEQIFEREILTFGPVLNTAKMRVLAAHPGWEDVVLTMQLFGDPAQDLALPLGADYTPLDLRVDADEVFGDATLQVDATLRNNSRLTPDSLDVIVLGYTEGAAVAETLFTSSLAPFAGRRSLSFAWSVGQRRGPYRLELLLDPDDRIAEDDDDNNHLGLHLNILEPLLPDLVFPPSAALVSPPDLQLEALVPPDGGPFFCEFALCADLNFDSEEVQLSSPVSAEDGLAVYHPQALDEERPYFWRARLRTSGAVGPWSASRSFKVSTSFGSGIWHQEGTQLLETAGDDVELDSTGRLHLSSALLPFRPSSATREDGFTVRDLDGAGVLATDGTYVYAKRWYNDASTVYPGVDRFTRVGSGFNDIHRSGNFGLLADSTSGGISATYHSDGYIYSESGRAFELERISAATGRLDTVAVPDGLLEWKYGRVEDGHSLITSDGRYLYNVSMSSERGIRTEWGVRVFDPSDGFSLVREFTSPPTETGFTFEWTDGILADGQRLYFIEYGGQRRIRMVDAFDGRFLDEWTSDQDTTRVISGQYDWVNNKVWLGDLMGSAIFRYAGLGQIDSARVTSAIIGPAAGWERLRFRGEGDLAIDLLIREDDAWVPHPDFTGLSADREIDLSFLDPAAHPTIRLQGHLRRSPQTARLISWSADFVPRPSLQLAGAAAALKESGLQVTLQLRNLSSFRVDEARLRLERSDRSAPVLERFLAPLGRGETRQVLLDSLELPPEGVSLFARILSELPDAEAADDRLQVPLLFGGHIPLLFHLWPDDRPFLDGDLLRPDQGLVIRAPELPGARIALVVDGYPTEPDSLFGDFSFGGPGVLYRPHLSSGSHHLQVRLLRDGEEIGLRQIRFHLSERLAIANCLIYPHPVRDISAFTYVLSHDARVSVEIYSLSGRLVRSLGPQEQAAGFRQIEWDGTDAGGRLLASGTYLYRLRARSGNQEAIIRAPLVVVR